MRNLLPRGTFKPGERLREVRLAARLIVSRAPLPLRLVLDRLEHEGLLTARPKGGSVVSAFTVGTTFISSGRTSTATSAATCCVNV